jgi:hypothetical protein
MVKDTGMTKGLLHLNSVPLVGANGPFERVLKTALRKAADTGNGRDTALEEYYHECLSYLQLRKCMLVRISNVDHAGKERDYFNGRELLNTLTEAVVVWAGMKWTVYHRGHDYTVLYDAVEFNLTAPDRMLYVPNRTHYVKTLVLVPHSKTRR